MNDKLIGFYFTVHLRGFSAKKCCETVGLSQKAENTLKIEILTFQNRKLTFINYVLDILFVATPNIEILTEHFE